MTNTTYNITAAEAREIALREACLDGAEFRSVTFEDGLWDVEFTANELYYVCYVDATTGEVPGMTFAATPVESYPAAEQTAASATVAA